MQNLAGIKHDPYDSGVNALLIQPRLAAKLTFAEGSLRIPCGKVRVRWDRTDFDVTVKCTVPRGAAATLRADNGYRLENGGFELALPEGENEIRLLAVN